MRILGSIILTLWAFVPLLVPAQPTDTASVSTMANFTLAGGREDIENYHFSRNWLADPWAYYEERIAPVPHQRIMLLKAFGMENKPNVDSPEEKAAAGWKVIGTAADGDPVYSRGFGPNDLKAINPDLYDKTMGVIRATAATREEVLVYIGCPPIDAPQSVIDAWAGELVDVPNVSIGLDSAGGCREDDPCYKLARRLLALGIKVYLEPPPPYGDADHWMRLASEYPGQVGWVIVDQHYELRTSGGRWYTGRELGDVVVILQGSAEKRWEFYKTFRATAPDHMRLTIATSMRGFTEDQVSETEQ